MNHSFFFDTTKTYLFHSDPGFLRPPRCSPNNVVVQTLTTPPFLFSNSFCRKEMEIEMILPRSNERSARGKGNRTRDLIYGGYRFSTESSSSTSWRRWVNWPSIMRIREPILLSLSPIDPSVRWLVMDEPCPLLPHIRLSRFDIDTRFLLRLSTPVDR